jgi:UDP-N-acetylmuramate--alanine ligase
VSSAIKRDNPELVAARAQRLPVVKRAEMLAELMRDKRCVAVAGTHGKTTTTSLVATLLDAGGLDPTVINGGIINAYGTNARPGAGEWMVVEADESDGTFLKLPAEVAIVTNVDPEHLDHFGDFDGVKKGFRSFIENLPFYGFAAVCLDHPTAREIIGQVEDRRVISYGESEQAEARLLDLDLSGGVGRFSVLLRDRDTGAETRLDELLLPAAGRHNALNATAAIAVAHRLGVPADKIRDGLARFGGVKRRFTKTGEWNGITVVDDYGHHPVEIAAVLKAARAVTEGRVIAVVQPHRYTRLRDLMTEFSSCFNDADTVIVADVYPAGEQPIEGVDKHALADGVRRYGHRHVQALENAAVLPRLIKEEAKAGDLVVLLGAGDITSWAYALPGQLEALAK